VITQNANRLKFELSVVAKLGVHKWVLFNRLNDRVTKQL